MASLKIRHYTSKPNKAGQSPLLVQIFSGNTKELSLGISIKPEFWDHPKQQIRRKHPRQGALNAIIRSRLSDLQNIIDELQKEKVNFTADEIVRKYKNKPVFKSAKTTIITKFLEDHVTRNPDSRKRSTLLTYNIFINSFSDFRPNLTFEDLNLAVVKEYDKYLKKKGLAINTISNRMKILRKAITLAIQGGILNRNPMLGYKRIREAGKIEFLTRDEIKKIENFNAPTPRKQKIIDLYLFRVYCGLRVGDQMTLKKSNVNIVDEDVYLDLAMNKVRGRVAFKLSDKAKVIYHKYNSPQSLFVFNILNENRNLKNETILLGEISNRTSYFNKVTKDMATLLKINKTVTSHTARHSFATISLSIGIPIHVVSNLLGHKSIKETQIYAKVLDSSKDEAIDLWNKI